MWERVIVGMVGSVMATATLLLVLSASHGGLLNMPISRVPWPGQADGSHTDQASARTLLVGGGPARQGDRAGTLGARRGPAGLGRTADARLAAVLRQVMRGRAGSLAVGVGSAGTTLAAYDSVRRFPAAGLARLDVLAAVLLDSQLAGRGLPAAEQGLARQMMTADSSAAAARLWRDAGEALGLAQINRRLGLSGTAGRWPGGWDQVHTTAADQVRLLADLTSPASPLSARWRRFALALLRLPRHAFRGAAAAGRPDSVPLACNGWWRDPSSGRWGTSSVAVVRHRGRQLLVVVLVSGQPTRASARTLAEAAARAAARASGLPG